MPIVLSPTSMTEAAAGGSMPARPPRVFISYSHDSPAHADRVLDLADRLRRDGIDATIDQYVGVPPEGWPRWMDRQVAESDFVLLVCTETYYRRSIDREEPDKGFGVLWEINIIFQYIYDARSKNDRFIPILFCDCKRDYIPIPIKGGNAYFVDSEDDYRGLQRQLTGQRPTPPPVAQTLRQWRDEPEQAQRFAELRRCPGVIIQSDGDGRTIVAGQPHLTLARWHGRRRPVRSPVDLLNPFSRAIGLVGREAEMAGLQAWLGGEAPIAARCLVGAAGVGKTRLAIELCEWAEAREWRSGFIEAKELARFLDQQNLSAWGWQDPTLAVIDNAAGTARVLRQWLVELAANPGVAGRPLRLLLLERHAERDVGWWHDLVTPRSFQEDGLLDLFDPPEPCPLATIACEDDRTRLAAAAAAAAGLGGESAPSAYGLADVGRSALHTPPITEPLVLLMDAVTASGKARGRTELAERLAQFELGRLATLAEDRQLKGEFLCDLAAFVTLTGGLSLDAAPDAIAAEQLALRWQGAGDPPEMLSALRDGLSEVDGGEGRRIAPILPELIGGAATLAVLQRHPTAEQAAIVRRAYTADERRCTAAVIRTAQDFATEDEHSSVRWLDALVEGAKGSAELITIADQLPERTICMIETAVGIERRVVDALRSDVTTGGSVGARATLARRLSLLASRLRDVCRLEDARAAADEAVQLHRALDHDENASRPVGDFAQSLLILGGVTCDLGQRDQALAASSEAVTLLRQRPQAVSPRVLARALAILSAHLGDMGRRDDALATIDEAMALYRDQATRHPDSEASELALALLNLAYCRSDVDQADAALLAAEESVDILAGLAPGKPDAFLPAYARALDSASVQLARAGQVAPAVERSREAIDIQRRIAAGAPEAYRPDLALMLNGYANALYQAGDADGARAALEEGVAILRELAGVRPNAYRPALARQLNNMSILLVHCGEVPAALATGRQAVDLLRDLAATRPDRHDDDLAKALLCLAFVLQQSGEPEPMRSCADQSVTLYRRLAGQWPSVFCPKLARSLLALSEASALCGRAAEAATAATEASSLLAASSAGDVSAHQPAAAQG